MKLGPFTLARTTSLELHQKASLDSLQTITGSRRVWSWLHEITTGGWQRNEEVNVDTALSNPTLYACVTLIAGDIAKLRPMLVEQDEDGIWSEITTGSPFLPVLRQPNPHQMWVDYAEWYFLSKLCHGNTYVLKRRDQRGVVNGLYILDPFRVTPLVAPDLSVFYQLSPQQMAPIEESVVVPAREIIHDVMCPLFHQLVGVSPIYSAGFPAVQGLNIRDSSDKFFRNGSRPGGVLLVPGQITQAQADEMKTTWKASFSGDNQGDIAVLTGNMSYLPMGMMTAEQSRLVDQLHMTDEDICKPFHMPRHKVGVGPDPSHNNVEAKNKDYLIDCLQKHIVKFQAHHTQGLEVDQVPGKTLAIELDLDDLSMMDASAKADAAQKAVNAGLSYNEARFRYWDAPPVRGGESPLAQQQYYSLEALAKRDAGTDPFATASATRSGVVDVTPAPDDTEPETKAFDLPTFELELQKAMAA